MVNSHLMALMISWLSQPKKLIILLSILLLAVMFALGAVANSKKEEVRLAIALWGALTIPTVGLLRISKLKSDMGREALVSRPFIINCKLMFKIYDRDIVYYLRHYEYKENANIWRCDSCKNVFLKHRMFFDHPQLKKPDKVYCRRCLKHVISRQFKLAS